MYIQHFVKGIRSRPQSNSEAGFNKQDAWDIILSSHGIICNWWRDVQIISPPQIATKLTALNLHRHLHDYGRFEKLTPFISVATGCIERDALLQQNVVHHAVTTARGFATNNGKSAGALFYGWLIVGTNKAVRSRHVAEAVRELHVYRRWSPYQLEGEVTAKIEIPAVQIQRVEWWDLNQDSNAAIDCLVNQRFMQPQPLLNLRELF